MKLTKLEKIIISCEINEQWQLHYNMLQEAASLQFKEQLIERLNHLDKLSEKISQCEEE